MRRIHKIAWSGMLALMVSGAAFAHGPGGYYDYPNSGLTGGVTVWGNSVGQSGYAGTLSYGVGYGYAPGYVPWMGHRHGPQCGHAPGYGYPQGYQYGHEQGYGHGNKHGHKHDRKHHRRHH